MKIYLAISILLLSFDVNAETWETSLSFQVAYVTYNKNIDDQFFDAVESAFADISSAAGSTGSYTYTGLSDAFGLGVGVRRFPYQIQLSYSALTPIELEGMRSEFAGADTFSNGFASLEGTFTSLSIGYEIPWQAKAMIVPIVGVSYFLAEGDQTVRWFENNSETQRETKTIRLESTSFHAGGMLSYQFNPKIRGNFYMHKIFAADTTSNIGAAIGYIF